MARAGTAAVLAMPRVSNLGPRLMNHITVRGRRLERCHKLAQQPQGRRRSPTVGNQFSRIPAVGSKNRQDIALLLRLGALRKTGKNHSHRNTLTLWPEIHPPIDLIRESTPWIGSIGIKKSFGRLA
jgi:hypothetical protein